MIADPMHTMDALTAFTPESDFENLPAVTGERRGETYVGADGEIIHTQPADREFSYVQTAIDNDKDA